MIRISQSSLLKPCFSMSVSIGVVEETLLLVEHLLEQPYDNGEVLALIVGG